MARYTKNWGMAHIEYSQWVRPITTEEYLEAYSIKTTDKT